MRSFDWILFLLALLISGCSSLPNSSVVADSRPKPVFLAQPQYPIELHKNGITGEALVEFIISKSGSVVEARVVKATHPLFGQAAVEAILRSKFTSPIKGGVPVNARMQMPTTFELAPEAMPKQPPEPTPASGRN